MGKKKLWAACNSLAPPGGQEIQSGGRGVVWWDPGPTLGSQGHWLGIELRSDCIPTGPPFLGNLGKLGRIPDQKAEFRRVGGNPEETATKNL